MKFYFENQLFSYQLLKTLSQVDYESADLGECMLTARRITDGDAESWFEEWMRAGKNADALGDQVLQKDHRMSARRAYLRASNYFRSAETFLMPEDPRKMEAFEASRAAFNKAMEHLEMKVERVSIPYGDTPLSGHLYRPGPRALGNPNEPYPTLILLGGNELTLEEMYSWGAAAAVRHGYNCLTFSGPGQGEALRLQHLAARFDYEAVLSPALNWLAQQPGVHPDRIALMGVDFGSYYAARSAAFDPRVRALVLQGGLYDYWDTLSRQSGVATALDLLGSPALLVKAASGVAERVSPEMRLAIAHADWVFGTKSTPELISHIKRFTLSTVAPQISCPTFILHGDRDTFVPTLQAITLYESLSCPKVLKVFTEADASPQHCQVGSLSIAHDAIFDWLDETTR